MIGISLKYLSKYLNTENTMKSLIREIRKRSANKANFLIKYFKSGICGFLQRKEYRNIRDLCLFVGYGRSGHTLVASLLDAHPNIIIGIEWGLLAHVKLGFRRNQVFYSLIERSRYYSKKLKNVWTGYSYQVANQWQGKYNNIEIIGDKFGEVNARKIWQYPDILNLTEQRIGLKPKLIHVIRNPFDIITTKTIRRFEMDNIDRKPETLDMLFYIQKVFKNAQVIMNLKVERKYSIIDIYHEDLIAHPQHTLKNLLNFLEVEADEDYLKACVSIIYKNSHKSRFSLHWPQELIDFIEIEIKKYPFLSHYRYAD